MIAVSKGTETKTIMEFLAENPNVDVSRAWERCWNIHSKIVERVQARFGVQRHAQSDGFDYWGSPDGQLEGAFKAYSDARRSRRNSKSKCEHRDTEIPGNSFENSPC